jgi:hypothetical protein
VVGRRMPPVTLQGPATPVAPGNPIPCTVSLFLPRRMQARAVRVEVVGLFRWTVGGWGAGPLRLRRWAQERVVHTRKTTPLDRALGPGVASYRVEVAIPPGSPPSVAGEGVKMLYLLRASLDVPHAPDRWEQVPLTVVAATPPERAPSPPHTHPGITVCLPLPPILTPGHRLQGDLVLSSSHPLVLAGPRLELVQVERSPRGEGAFVAARALLPSLSLGAYQERRVPFALLVPPTAPPTCTLPRGSAITWAIRLVARDMPPLFQQEVLVHRGAS